MSARRHRGLTLVEVLVTTVVVGAGLAVAASALSTSLRAEVHAANNSRAARLLDTLLGRIDGGVLPLEDALGDFTEDGAPDVTWAVQIIPTDQDKLVEVLLTVSWTEHGAAVSESLSRWVYEAPPAEGTATGGSGQ